MALARLSAPERAVFAGPALEVAPRLLHLVLARGPVAGRIVEVEAYEGAGDPASHAYRGRTARNASMFGPPGHLYAYRSYGIHTCANVVCGPEGTASAVLVRALEPLSGLEAMRRGRPARLHDDLLCSGPGRLATSLAVALDEDGRDLLAAPAAPEDLVLLDDGTPPPDRPLVGPRVGLSKACADALWWRWRFAAPGNRAVSRPRLGGQGSPPGST